MEIMEASTNPMVCASRLPYSATNLEPRYDEIQNSASFRYAPNTEDGLVLFSKRKESSFMQSRVFFAWRSGRFCCWGEVDQSIELDQSQGKPEAGAIISCTDSKFLGPSANNHPKAPSTPPSSTNHGQNNTIPNHHLFFYHLNSTLRDTLYLYNSPLHL